MSKEFKEGFSKGIGLTTGVLAIPAAGLLSPIAAKDESYWLIVLLNAKTSQKIEMESLEQ